MLTRRAVESRAIVIRRLGQPAHIDNVIADGAHTMAFAAVSNELGANALIMIS